MGDDGNRPTSFALHIQPLFRQVDVESMRFMFDLTNYEDVVANSQDILSCLKGEARPYMPPVTQGGPVAQRVDRSLQSLDRGRTSGVDTPWARESIRPITDTSLTGGYEDG